MPLPLVHQLSAWTVHCIFAYVSGWMHFARLCPQNIKCLVQKSSIKTLFWTSFIFKCIWSWLFDLNIPTCMALDSGVCTQGRVAVPRVWVTGFTLPNSPHPSPTSHPVLGARGSWEKGTRPQSDKGIRMERSAAPSSSSPTVTIMAWWHTYTHAHARLQHVHRRIHTGCVPTSESGPLLAVTFCLPPPHTGKHRPLRKQTSTPTRRREGVLLLSSGAWRHRDWHETQRMNERCCDSWEKGRWCGGVFSSITGGRRGKTESEKGWVRVRRQVIFNKLPRFQSDFRWVSRGFYVCFE